MKERRVRFTQTAAQHVIDEHAWWLANRDHQELFATELEDALKILATLPGAGTPYTRSTVPHLRRIYLRKAACHLYYTFDDDERSSAQSGARGESADQPSESLPSCVLPA